jgi:hypothetical protein
MVKQKLRWIFAVLLCTLTFGFVSCNSNNSDDVSNVTLSVDNAAFTGTCPHDTTFSGLIETNRGTTINYIWERSTGNSAQQTVDLPVGGGVIVQDMVHFTATGNVTVTLHVTAPENKHSTAVTATVTCQ